jgi:hypothetical protein
MRVLQNGTTHREPARRGYWYEEVRLAEVGPKHRASATRGKPQGESGEVALAEEHSA